MSYEYESPVLGTIDGLKDPVPRESEVFVTKESNKETENHLIASEVLETEDIYLIMHKVRVFFFNLIIIFIVTDSGFLMLALPGFWYQLLFSLFIQDICSNVQWLQEDVIVFFLVFSEPPDIRNWFSSYAYESFVLDTNDDVQDSVSEESECGKEGSLLGERHRRQENMAATGEFDVKSDTSLGDDKPDEKPSTKVKL